MLDVTQPKRMIVALHSTPSIPTHRTHTNIALADKTSTFGELTFSLLLSLFSVSRFVDYVIWFKSMHNRLFWKRVLWGSQLHCVLVFWYCWFDIRNCIWVWGLSDIYRSYVLICEKNSCAIHCHTVSSLILHQCHFFVHKLTSPSAYIVFNNSNVIIII